VWACPVCAARKRQERAKEIRRVVELHLQEGGGVLFWTGTMRHGQEHTLEEGIEAMNQAWGNRVISGSSWNRDREDFGVVGYVKSPDFTYGQSGWHPHMPVLIFTEEPLSEDEREELRQRIYERWCSGVRDSALGEPYKVNCPLEPVRSWEDVSDYVGMGPVKEDENDRPEGGMDVDVVGLELQRHDAKAGRHRPGADCYHFTPFELLREIHEWPDDSRREKSLWHEYEQATHGLNSIYWSSGLSDLRERAQEEAEEEEDVREVVLREIEPILWKVILRKSSVSRLLEVAEGLHEEDLNQFLGRMRARLLEMGPPL
jgi:hypothetical protein